MPEVSRIAPTTAVFRAPPQDDGLADYRKYAAERLGISESQLSMEIARQLRAQETAAKEGASAPFRAMLPEGPISDRRSAKRYFDRALKGIGTLQKSAKASAKNKNAGTNDTPEIRAAKAKAEKNIGGEIRDLMWRLRSTALNGNFPQMDGSEKELSDVLEDAQYAEALAQKAVSVVEHEASERFFELARGQVAKIKLGSAAEDVYEGAKAKLRAWIDRP